MDLRLPLIALVALLAPARALPAGSCTECHPVHHGTLGACVSCHRGDPRSRRTEIAHRNLIAGRFAHFAVPDSAVTARGQKLLDQAGCRRCHVSGGRGTKSAADLDRLLPDAMTSETMTAIQEPALFMPRFAFSEATATEIVTALFAGSARAAAPKQETPLVVHFERAKPQESGFQKHCGECHRILTRTQGGQGVGNTGPNLSGLFSEFYPGVFRDGERWAATNLKKWVVNPREIRRQALMPPLTLADAEWEQVLRAFDAEGLGAGPAPTTDGASGREAPKQIVYSRPARRM